MGALGSRPAHSASTRQTTAGPYRWPWFLALSLLGTLAFGLAMYLKRLKGCTARIMPNYSAFRKRNRFVVHADEKLTAFVELEVAIAAMANVEEITWQTPEPWAS